MINVEKINVNSITSNKQNISFGSSKKLKTPVTPYEAYRFINRDVNMDYAAGDISLLELLGNKLNNYWNILMNKDPGLEAKAMLIEESLKQTARNNNRLNAVA